MFLAIIISRTESGNNYLDYQRLGLFNEVRDCLSMRNVNESKTKKGWQFAFCTPSIFTCILSFSKNIKITLFIFILREELQCV